ncbi:hypothetical protein GJAV_G00056590 [Gymnothorax javanicus]|nr:hypothetical protein GJAV_G00056590 [Gymnothorax javanicus]
MSWDNFANQDPGLPSVITENLHGNTFLLDLLLFGGNERYCLPNCLERNRQPVHHTTIYYALHDPLLLKNHPLLQANQLLLQKASILKNLSRAPVPLRSPAPFHP